MGVEVDTSVDTACAGDGVTFPKAGDKLSMHYVGTLASDGSTFDSSRAKGREFQFTIGVGQVIKGWDEGVAKLSLGQRATLRITPDFGYGAAGAGGAIPPNADLVFDVELLKINGKKVGGAGACAVL
jgi:FK506-binding protein 1